MSSIDAAQLNIIYPNQSSVFNTTSINVVYNLTNANFTFFNYTCNIGVCGESTNYTLSLSGQSQGNKTLLFYVDETEIANSSNVIRTNTSLSFFIDSEAPSISFTSITDGSYINRTNIVINITTNDLSNRNITLRLYNSSRTLLLFAYTASNFLFYNSTALLNGKYYYNATTCDIYNFCSNSDTRDTIIDTINPGLNRTNITDITSSSARIYYYSNEEVTALINYGDNSSHFDDHIHETSPDTFSSIRLTGLEDLTTYYFNLTICDRANNCLVNGTLTFTTTNASIISPVVVSMASTNTSCTTTYIYSAWNECRSDGTQIRSYTKSNPNCFYPVPVVSQSCIYTAADPALTTSTVNKTNSTSIDYSWGSISTPWKIILILLGLGVIIGIGFWIYSFFSSSEPGDTTEYDPMGGYGINDYYDE
jgi:hypothetical protein